MTTNELDSKEKITLDDKNEADADAVAYVEESDLESKSESNLLLPEKVVTSQPTKVEPRVESGSAIDPTCCVMLSSCLFEFCHSVLPFCVLCCNGCLHGVCEGMVACFQICGECCLTCQCLA